MKTFDIQQNAAKTCQKHVKTSIWEVKKHRGEHIERRKTSKSEQIAHGGGHGFCNRKAPRAQENERTRDVQHVVKNSAYYPAAQADEKDEKLHLSEQPLGKAHALCRVLYTRYLARCREGAARLGEADNFKPAARHHYSAARVA